MAPGIIRVGFAWRYTAVYPYFTNVITGLLLMRTFILLVQGKLPVRTARPMKKERL